MTHYVETQKWPIGPKAHLSDSPLSRKQTPIVPKTHCSKNRSMWLIIMQNDVIGWQNGRLFQCVQGYIAVFRSAHI